MGRISRRTFTGLALAAATTRAQAAAPDRVIPLRLESNNLTVPVTLNGKGPFPFLMATGQLYALVSDDLAGEIGLQSRALPNVTGRTVGGAVSLHIYKADSMVLGGAWEMKNVELVARPFSSKEIFGAFPFLSIQMSTFDFEVPQMRVHNARVEPAAGSGKAAIIQLSGVRAIREPPKIRGQYGGQTLRLMIDTGHCGALTLFPDAVKRLNLWDRYPRTFTRTAKDEEGRVTELRHALGDPLEFAGQVVQRPLVTMMSPDKARADLVDYDGVIGMDVLRRFKVTFDPVKQNVWFAANSQLYEDFRYDRAGLDLDTEAEGLRVTQIDAGSPADRAGLRLGDLVVGVQSVSNADVRWLLTGKPGEVVTLDVSRAGARRDYALTLEERL